MDNDSLKENAEDLVTHLAQYIDIQKKLFTLRVAEKASVAASSLATGAIVGLVGASGFFFLSLALGFYLGTLLANSALGFLIVGLLYLALGVVFYLNRRVLVQDKIDQSILSNLLSNDKDELED